jgi:putative hydrolase of the HAD superfamily
MGDVKGVLFDYGMVLSGPPDPAARDDMKRVLGLDEPGFQRLYWKHREAYDRGTLSGVAYWETIARELHKPLDARQLNTLLNADTDLWTQPNREMIEWAAALQQAGIKTGILSNLGDAMEAGIRARFPWLEQFAHHTFSHRLGIAKPDAAIYRHAAEGLGLPPGEILFVDDKEENIAAARDAGMLAVQYTGHADFIAELQNLGLESLLAPVALGSVPNGE